VLWDPPPAPGLCPGRASCSLAAGSHAERTGHSGQTSCPRLEDMTELPCLYRTPAFDPVRVNQERGLRQEGDGPRSPA
jgi:hypothetical protein